MKAISSLQKSSIIRKRTRRNVQQSKNGCFTCRARKLKCDESRPTCSKCQASSRQCEGYRDQVQNAINNDTPQSLGTPRTDSTSAESSCFSPSPTTTSLSQTLTAPSEVQHHCRIGLDVLLGRHSQFQNDERLWIRILVQLSTVDDTLNKALAFLGTVYEAQLPSTSSYRPLLKTTRNCQALSSLRRAMIMPMYEPISLFLTSIVLAAAEVLQRHFLNALLHLHGAFQLLAHVRLSQQDFSHHKDRAQWTLNEHDYQNLYSFAQCLDLQASTFALSRQLELVQSFSPEKCFLENGEVPIADSEILSLLHSCYHFAGQASTFKYKNPSKVTPPLLLEQSRYIAMLNRWLAYTTSILDSSPYYLYIRRVQALSALIYLSTILSPFEISYDEHNGHFQQIIDLADIILGPHQETGGQVPQFQLEPGISQALFLSATKCRYSEIRHQAVSMLSRLGIEGPWNGQVMSRVAQRWIEIEEQGKQFSTDGSFSIIPERQRIHGCGMDSSPQEDGQPIHVRAQFSLCKDVEQMVKRDEHEDLKYWEFRDEDLMIDPQARK